MKLIKVAGAAINQTPLDWQGNLSRLREAFKQAKTEGVSVLCLPELAITGYGCEDAFGSPFLIKKAWECLESLLPESRSMVACVGLPVAHGGALFNCVALMCDGKLVGLIAKKNLAGDGVHYEQRWFKSWSEEARDWVEMNGKKIPIGNFHFDISGIKIGFEICEEAWVADRPGAKLSRLGVDIILNPSASHFAFGKRQVREGFVKEGSRAFGLAYVYSNLLGNESGRIIFDGGVLIASGGNIVAAGPRLSFKDVLLTSTVIDVEVNRTQRRRSASFQPILGESESCLKAELSWPKVSVTPEVSPELVGVTQNWEDNALTLKEEEFARAVALGLFDYLRKSRSMGFVISLSGGVDSAVVAALVSLSFRFGIQELGIEEVKKRLSFNSNLKEAKNEREIIYASLSCVYQATKNSSTTTHEAARRVADALGANFFEWDVEAIVSGYIDLVGKAMSRKLSWDTDDVTLQNIQARARAPGVWMMANLNRSLLLATSNRSEAAVGYATMDGDTCGGLSPIAGIDKNFLLKWIHWLQSKGPHGLLPASAVPELDAVTRLQPTAELRPPQFAQTDEKDLMPYAVLDAIERAAIRDKRSPAETLEIITAHFSSFSNGELKSWVKRFFRLWCQNQWKRERYAPSFHLDDESLDPKSWCRFPILSGAFEEELAKL